MIFFFFVYHLYIYTMDVFYCAIIFFTRSSFSSSSSSSRATTYARHLSRSLGQMHSHQNTLKFQGFKLYCESKNKEALVKLGKNELKKFTRYDITAMRRHRKDYIW